MKDLRPNTVSGRRSRAGLLGMAIAVVSLVIASSGIAAADPAPTPAPTPAVAPDRSTVGLVDLGDPGQVAAWTTVNDPVMGGLSTSSVTPGGGGLVFSGAISLANNGGFASARSPRDPEIGRRATGATSLRVRALGDGKTYLLSVGTSGQRWSYIQRFPTEAGVQRSYELPVANFQPVGMRLDPAPDAPQTLDPSGISQISVYILDKQEGPFAITINGIDAVS